MDIGLWLAGLGLQQYEPAFRSNDIDAEILPDLTADDLESIGVTSVGHRRRLLNAIASLKPSPEPERSSPPASGTAANRSFPRQHDAERRQLTVMFVDLVASTAISKRLDPEDMRSVLTAYQNAVAGAVTRFEGNVAKYMGDGVLCYFGYPHAHEDDAERAARAGLAIVEAVRTIATPLGDKLAARIGIATGLVVVGDLIGTGPAQEEAVVGDTPNLAARLQGIAAPGQVVLAATTRRLLGDVFALTDLGLHDFKGIAAQTPAFAVEGERASESRFEARSSGGLSPLIGREHELALMLERWRRAKAGEGQVILLSGEAGIGKSRLVRGMIDALADEAHTRVSYQCSPYHSDSPLYPTIQQLTFAAAFAPDDTNDDKLDRLERLLIDSEADRPLLAALLGLDHESRYGKLELTPQQQRTRTLDALVRQMTALASQRPVFFVIEDAHWIDPTTLELVDRCLDPIARSRVNVLITARPTFQHAFGGHPIVTRLALNKLGRNQVAAIVQRLTGGKSFPGQLLDVITEKTDGVPLFVEEMTKTVLESGDLVETATSYELARPLNRLVIPATLYDSLMARLDRLQPVKEVAQTAACIGRDFDYRLLKSIVSLDDAGLQDALERLTAAELIFRRGNPPDATYLFKHALVRDAAYESLLKTRRRELHRRAARALNDEFKEISESQPELIAHHLTEAGETNDAIAAWQRAGEGALYRAAYVEEAEHLGKAVALAETLPDGSDARVLRLRLQIAQGNALFQVRGPGAPETTAAFARAAELVAGIEDAATRFPAFYGLWVGSLVRGEPEPIRTLSAAFLRDAERDPGAPEFLIGHRIVGASAWYDGDYVGALPHLERALPLYDKDQHRSLAFRYGQDVGVAGMVFLALTLWPLGEIDRGRRMAEEAVTYAPSTGHVATVAYALSHICVLELLCRDPSRLSQHGRSLVAISHEHSLRFWVGYGTFAIGYARWHAGERDAGAADMRSGMDMLREQGIAWCRPLLQAVYAEVEAKTGEIDAALATIDDAFAFCERTGQRWIEAELHRVRGDILLRAARPDVAAIEVALRRAVDLARHQQTRTFELRATLSLARLYRATKREVAACSLLAVALDRFAPTAEIPEIAEAQALLGDARTIRVTRPASGHSRSAD